MACHLNTSLTQPILQHMRTISKKGLLIKKVVKPWDPSHSDVAPL